MAEQGQTQGRSRRRKPAVTRQPENRTTNKSAPPTSTAGKSRGAVVLQWTQTVLAGLAAIATLAALVYTAQTTRAAVESVDLTAKGQITERFTAAVSQLGDDHLAVRLGGIYALERIAEESPKDQGAILDILTGFLRENSRAAKRTSKVAPIPETPEARTAIPQPPYTVSTDIQAAGAVLGRRNIANDPPGYELNLTDVDFRGAQLEGANFSKAWILGADFSGARMTGADFSSARLRPGEVDETTPLGAAGSVSFRGAVLDGANFRNSLLRGAVFAGAWLPDANLSDADFSLSDFRNSVVVHADLRGNFGGSNFTAARMNSANVTGAYLGGSATVKNAELSGVDFRKARRGPKEYQIGSEDKQQTCTGNQLWIPMPGCPER